jgi:Flp pilus assembly protein TadG
MNLKYRIVPRAQAGMAMIEFALVLPLLMLLLLGAVEIGRLAYFAIEVGNAAHAGAQFGALSLTNAVNTTGMSNAATDDGQNSISTLTINGAQTVCTCWNGSTQVPSPATHAACGTACTTGGRSITYVRVSVQGTIPALFDYGALGLPNSWTVTRVATMRVTPRQ